MTIHDSIAAEVTALEEAGLRRTLRPLHGQPGPVLGLAGRDILNFCSNDYLGLAGSPLLAEALRESADRGAGAAAARLVTGNLEPQRVLEESLAAWLEAESALLYNSGYQANVGLVSALAGPEDLVLSDALNHASLIDGCRLSRATIAVYPHRDVDEVRRVLVSDRGKFRRCLLLTESLFSMDGDQAPLEELATLSTEHDVGLIVDESHAIGVLGLSGRGLAWALPTFARMGTLGKALGTFGAFVLGSQPLYDLLISKSRSFIFSTALPPSLVATSARAVALAASDYGEVARVHLRRLTDQLETGLRGLGIAVSGSHIVPLRIRGGDPATTMRVCERLLERGVFVQGIRPPTVPAGTSRLRLSLSAGHSEAQVSTLLDGITQMRDEFA